LHESAVTKGLAPSLVFSQLLHGQLAYAGTLLRRVINVADGDTITLLDAINTQHKIRLAGIDAPEKKQAFGQRSRESLSDLVFSKSVTVETNKRDKYGREVGKVIVGSVDANLVQIQRGMAWHYKAYEREQSVIDRKGYAEAENEARAARRGLWADAEPLPPWEFRRKKRGFVPPVPPSASQ
jgi:endonuclease YncB( thermonuclease family)